MCNMSYERGKNGSNYFQRHVHLPQNLAMTQEDSCETVKLLCFETRLQELGHSRLNTDYHLWKAPLLLCGAFH